MSTSSSSFNIDILSIISTSNVILCNRINRSLDLIDVEDQLILNNARIAQIEEEILDLESSRIEDFRELAELSIIKQEIDEDLSSISYLTKEIEELDRKTDQENVLIQVATINAIGLMVASLEVPLLFVAIIGYNIFTYFKKKHLF